MGLDTRPRVPPVVFLITFILSHPKPFLTQPCLDVLLGFSSLHFCLAFNPQGYHFVDTCLPTLGSYLKGAVLGSGPRDCLITSLCHHWGWERVNKYCFFVYFIWVKYGSLGSFWQRDMCCLISWVRWSSFRHVSKLTSAAASQPRCPSKKEAVTWI